MTAATLVQNNDALRARVAKLEAALTKISTAARRAQIVDKMAAAYILQGAGLRAADPALVFIVEVVDAALKDAPQ
jgi:hypothetical protein